MTVCILTFNDSLFCFDVVIIISILPFFSCFISKTAVFFGVFLGPIFALALFNTVVFLMIVPVLIRHKMREIKTADKKQKIQGSTRATFSIISMMFMFNLQWLFGALTIAEASLPFQWIFVILVTLQGLFLSIFFCVVGKNAREEWLKFLLRRKQGLHTMKVPKPLKVRRKAQPIAVVDAVVIGGNMPLKLPTTPYDVENPEDEVTEAVTPTHSDPAISKGHGSVIKSTTPTVPPETLDISVEVHSTSPSPRDLPATPQETVERMEDCTSPKLSLPSSKATEGQ